MLSTLTAWRIIESTGPGRSVVKAIIPVDDTRLVSWLVEAQLRSLEPSSGRLLSLLGHPVMFPFRFCSVTTGELSRANPRLDSVQQGLGDELIVLRQ